MTPEHWQRVKQLLQSTLERKPNERSAYLAEACTGDESLRKDVEELIISHEQAGSFIEESPLTFMPRCSQPSKLSHWSGRLLGHTALSPS